MENWSLLQNVKLCVDFMICLSNKIFFLNMELNYRWQVAHKG